MMLIGVFIIGGVALLLVTISLARIVYSDALDRARRTRNLRYRVLDCQGINVQRGRDALQVIHLFPGFPRPGPQYDRFWTPNIDEPSCKWVKHHILRVNAILDISRG